ncbi:ATP-dependent protease, partial [Vibrio alfacsensis]
LHTEESFAELPDDEQERFGLTIDELEVSLRGMARELTDWEETYTDNIQKLNEEVTLGVISHLIKKLKKEYNGYTEIKKYFTELQKDICENVDIFLEEGSEQG